MLSRHSQKPTPIMQLWIGMNTDYSTLYLAKVSIDALELINMTFSRGNRNLSHSHHNSSNVKTSQCDKPL
jgi:hypothetical protein